jgi:hypothetical protein
LVEPRDPAIPFGDLQVTRPTKPLVSRRNPAIPFNAPDPALEHRREGPFGLRFGVPKLAGQNSFGDANGSLSVRHEARFRLNMSVTTV